MELFIIQVRLKVNGLQEFIARLSRVILFHTLFKLVAQPVLVIFIAQEYDNQVSSKVDKSKL
jgi:hypothetical protein